MLTVAFACSFSLMVTEVVTRKKRNTFRREGWNMSRACVLVANDRHPEPPASEGGDVKECEERIDLAIRRPGIANTKDVGIGTSVGQTVTARERGQERGWCRKHNSRRGDACTWTTFSSGTCLPAVSAVNGGDGCQDTTGYQMSWDCIRETKQRAPECICHGACTRGPLFVNVCTCPHDSQACCCSAKNVTRLG